jgi:hypothetical protein
MLVTDNAANMALARRLVVESVGFKHILQLRWVGGLHVEHMFIHMRCCVRCRMVLCSTCVLLCLCVLLVQRCAKLQQLPMCS